MTTLASREFAEFNGLLASAVERGMGLEASMDFLAAQARSTELRGALTDASAALKDGASLSQALERHPGVFPDDYRALIRAGVEGGNLAEVLRFSRDYHDLRAELHRKLRRLAFHLGLLMAVSLLLVAGLIIYGLLFRWFYEVLALIRVQLPPTMALVRWAVTHPGIALPVLCVMLSSGFVGGIFFFRWGSRRGWGYLIPVWGKILKARDLSIFCAAMAVKCRAGAPLPEALASVKESLPNRRARRWARKLRTSVLEGQALSSAMFYLSYYPRSLTWAVSMGESRGEVGQVFSSFADVYRAALKRRFEALFILMSPLGIILVGNVAFFAAAVAISPLFIMLHGLS